MNTQIIAIANQKGGVGKTTTCANFGIGLEKVLLIDGDLQGSLTISLGNPQPDKLPFTLSDAMGKILMDRPIRPGEGILHHAEGVDLMPAYCLLSSGWVKENGSPPGSRPDSGTSGNLARGLSSFMGRPRLVLMGNRRGFLKLLGRLQDGACFLLLVPGVDMGNTVFLGNVVHPPDLPRPSLRDKT